MSAAWRKAPWEHPTIEGPRSGWTERRHDLYNRLSYQEVPNTDSDLPAQPVCDQPNHAVRYPDEVRLWRGLLLRRRE